MELTLIILILTGGIFYCFYTPPDNTSIFFILLITILAGPICWSVFIIKNSWDVFKYFIYVLNKWLNCSDDIERF